MEFDNFRDNRVLKEYLRIKEEQEEISNNIRKKRNQQQNKERWAKYQNYLTTILTDKMFDFAVGSGAKLLDIVPNAAAAYSLRKLRTAYTGSAIEVRRSSDLAVQDIGFDRFGNLDTTALTTFVNEDVDVYTSDFRVIGDPPVDQEDLGESNGTAAGGQSVADEDDAYKFTCDSTISFHSATTPSIFEVGQVYNVSFKYYIPSGQTIDGIRFIDWGISNQSTLDEWVTVNETNLTSTRSNIRFFAADGTDITPSTNVDGNVFYLKDIIITQTTADGHVRTWYDQSGNTNNALNGTATRQPLIVNTGSLVTEEGKPVIQFDGGVTYNSLEKQFSPSLSQPITIFGVMKNNDGNKDHFYDGYISRFSFGYDSLNLVMNAGSGLNAGVYATGVKLVSNLWNTTDSKLNINGVTEASGDVGTGIMDGISIGALRTSLSTSLRDQWSLNGNIQELIIFNSDQSDNRKFIEAQINSFYKIYP